jgi:hypothetical protein
MCLVGPCFRGLVLATVGVVIGVSADGCQQGQNIAAVAQYVCPASLGAVGAEDRLDLQAAALWWWIDRLESVRDIGWLFVSLDGQDADAVQVVRLREGHRVHTRNRELADRILSRAAASIDQDGIAHHVTTQGRGLTLGVSSIDFWSPAAARALVDFAGCGDLCGGSTEVFLRCDESGWRVYGVGQGMAY